MMETGLRSEEGEGMRLEEIRGIRKKKKKPQFLRNRMEGKRWILEVKR